VVQSGKTGIVYAFLPNAKKVQELVQALAGFAGVDTGASGAGLTFRLPKLPKIPWWRKHKAGAPQTTDAPDTQKTDSSPDTDRSPLPPPTGAPASAPSIPALRTRRVDGAIKKLVIYMADVVQFATQVSIGTARPYATGISVVHEEQTVGAIRADWSHVRLEITGRNLEGLNLAITDETDDAVAGPIDCETTPAGTAKCTIPIKDTRPGTYDVVLATADGVITRLFKAVTIV
jgi:hypothetical protein